MLLTIAATLLAGACDKTEIIPPHPPVGETWPDMVFCAQFNNDGTATDRSPLHSAISLVAGKGLVTYPAKGGNNPYFARFSNTPGNSTSSGYYKFTYSTVTQVRDALKGGYALETQFMLDAEPDAAKEYCAFSAMADGGTGILVSAESEGGCITFVTNVSMTGRSNWIRCTSGVRPERGAYYHVLGRWDKEKGVAQIYVNGELKNTVDAAGEIVLPRSVSYWWFGIGGDANDGNAESAWKGDIAKATIYSHALNDEELDIVFRNTDMNLPRSDFRLDGVNFLESWNLYAGNKLVIIGNGFEEGDRVRFESLEYDTARYESVTTIGQGRLTAELSGSPAPGKYRIVLIRGNVLCPLGIMEFTHGGGVYGVPKVIAHRGLHKNGASENSIASLRNACELGCYGSETDVYITTDGRLVIHHDSSIGGKAIETSSYDELKDMTLGNGEKLPLLEDFLDCVKSYNGTKLIIEFKNTSAARLAEAVDAVAAMVTEKDADALVEYIGFDYDTCRNIAKKKPGAMVGYLGGNISPSVLFENGIRSIDYNFGTLLNTKRAWIEEAHELGMVVNVWTPNSESDLLKCIAAGADCITTDNSDDLTNIISTYFL